MQDRGFGSNFLYISMIIMLLLAFFPAAAGEENSIRPVTDNGKLNYSIWEYSNMIKEPSKALVLEMEHKQWQALVGICTAPAFIHRGSTTPLFFADSNSEVNTIAQKDIKKVTDFGTDAASGSKKVATDYWSKAELVFIVETYEHALWVVPSAAFYGAPILVTPTQETLTTLGTKCAMVVGNGNYNVADTIRISEKTDVWEFQLALFESKGVYCNYVILTNPRDTEDTTPENIKWPFQSPAAAILAAYHSAIIQTGDWSIDRKAFEAVETKSNPDQTNYDKIKPSFTKLKADSYEVEKYLIDNGHSPEYLAAVGGPYAVPNYIYDIHVDYKYPIGTPAKTQYPSSLAAYATLSETVDATVYTKEDLAAGRLAAGNIFDLTNQLMRTFYYREYLSGGDYYSSMPIGWENKASFVDGHRLNQPEPNNLIWDPNLPYYPYEGVNPTFNSAGLTVGYYLPRNESDPYDSNKTIDRLMEETTNYGFFHFMPHGGVTNLRIEVGVDNVTGRQNMFLEASTINELNYKAPTMVYTTCCKGGVWMLDTGYEPDDFITSSFIHAGAVAYIATPEIQSTCFWDQAPHGTATDQAIKFWENVFSGNVPIGKAFRDAKWSVFSTWDSKTPKPNSPKTHHVDSISYTLFGDPALELYKPKVKFKDESKFEFKVKVEEIKTDKEFTVEISITDLASGNAVTDATVKVTFAGTEKTGSIVTFKAPNDAGEHELEVMVSKSGYTTAESTAWVQMEKVKKEENGQGFIPGFDSLLIMSAIAMILILSLGARKRSIK